MSNIITIKRASPRDLIQIPLFLGPSMGAGTQVTASQILAELDTGNDHTAVSRDILQECGVEISNEEVHIQGVAGTEIGYSAITNLVLHFDDGEQCRIREHVVVAASGLTCDALLGRDFLRWFDVTMLRDGTVTLAYS